MGKSEQFCPCCSFDIDLFLPDSEKTDKAGSGSINEDSDKNEDALSSSLLNLSLEEILKKLVGECGIESQDHDDKQNLPIVIVDTHGHAQLDRERNEAYSLEGLIEQRGRQKKRDTTKKLQGIQNFHVKSLACSVEPADFDATLKYAAMSDFILPALGVHPWYIENIPGYTSKRDRGDFDSLDKEWLDPLEQLLLEHPNCLVGEIGLCKIAKWVRTYPDGKAAAMAIQKRVFKKQMLLAARLRRPVSVHCVNSHGIFVSAINEILEQTKVGENMTSLENNDDICITDDSRWLLPPAIAMHSFTGTAHHVKELLDLEHCIDFPKDTARRKKKKSSKSLAKAAENNNLESPRSLLRPPLFYFGFSHTVNYAMCTSEKSRKKGKEAIQAVPLDRLLVESDVHSDADVAGGTLGAISYVAWARNMQLRDVMSVTSKNGSSFLGSIRR